MGDAFLGKSGTKATLAAEGVAEGGCILGLLAASAAMVSRISANKGGVATWKSPEGCRRISCSPGVFANMPWSEWLVSIWQCHHGSQQAQKTSQTRTLGKTERCFGIEDRKSDNIQKPLEPKMGLHKEGFESVYFETRRKKSNA